MKLLLYCTKAMPYLYRTPEVMNFVGTFFTYSSNKNLDNCTLNGTIVAKCDIDLITKNDLVFDRGFNEETQLSLRDIVNYVGNKEYYCLHLSNIEVFDEPRELSDYCTKQCPFAKCSTCIYGKNNITCSTIDTPITKAPQNMMSVYDSEKNHYILISIQPQWLCKILNGEKTVEVRKKILNCMKEVIENE